MSESEPDVALPNDQTIEDALRSVVREATKRDEAVTVKSARAAAEERLGLDSGYLKDDVEWKQRSADIIRAAFDEPASPEVPAKKPVKAKAGAKRKSDDADGKQLKKRRKAAAADSEEDGKLSSESLDGDAPKSKVKPNLKLEAKVEAKSGNTSALSSPPDTDALEEEEEAVASKPNGKTDAEVAVNNADDESELSSVIDDPPPKKKRQKKSTSPSATKSKPVKATKSTAPAKTEKVLSPDEEEIKRLQSWLLKCGIRKLWHRELEPYSTPKEKIKHLRGMLEDVGMTGRYSAEKAKQIKEQRELKAELEAAKEFNDQWGHEQDDDEDGEGEEKRSEEGAAQRRGRLKPRGLIDFGDDDDESE